MTRTTTLALSGLVLGLAVVTTGCKKSKEVAKPKGEIEIVEYCTGSEYQSSSKHFRSSATGESQDREIAKKKARSNAESRLAKTVSVTVKAVTDNYVSSTEFNNREEATESFNELSRSVVDQELRGAIAICEKLTQRENGIYVSYVALELSGEKLASKYNEKVSEDERIMAEYNYERFKETFQEEMDKLGN
ncbi:MAG: hypothetical protein P8P45_01555 [Flavobacteriales bacterium]|nr:hypothetical protein [Flavobacteriales bacterium]